MLGLQMISIANITRLVFLFYRYIDVYLCCRIVCRGILLILKRLCSVREKVRKCKALVFITFYTSLLYAFISCAERYCSVIMFENIALYYNMNLVSFVSTKITSETQVITNNRSTI